MTPFVSRPRADEPAPDRAPSARPEGPPARVLIVDDDERNGFAAREALQDLGHELVVVKSGEEALWRLLKDEFAVILLDLHMPGMDGYETAQHIRTHHRTRDIPIVFLTAVFRDEAHLFQAYSAGAVDVVFKPVDPFILRSKVQVLVDLHQKRVEVARQASHLEGLLVENARVHAEKLAAERALRRAQERQQAIMGALPIVFHSRTLDEPFAPTFVSDGVQALTGFEAGRFIDEPGFGFSRVHPDDRAPVAAALRAAVRHGGYTSEFRWLCADGTYRTLLDQGVLAPALEGEGQELFGILIDATERRVLEEQLAQARKMEAVGQLTGGVAHDFNNLLTVVLGNVDLLSRKIDGDERLHRQLSAVRHAAERGRTLTRQLLAFSRRQHLSPVTLDVNAQIREFAPLLQQAVGDAVTLVTEIADEEICVHLDPAHLETALLNLAVNAHDAMPDGGRLTLRTQAADPPSGEHKAGRWLKLCVSDTGHGMAPELIARIFEPFFTTKDVGKGSGLGLSQVYGFVSQSGGEVKVSSAMGEGSTFEIWLPVSEHKLEPRTQPEPVQTPVGGNETILVVEDDPEVLALTVEMLAGLGYRVAAVGDAQEALKRLKTRKPVDLLFSDVVMPGGMSGVQLAREARRLRPELGVLLTSGYVGDQVVMAENEFPLIDKPYERPALAARLREILDGRTAPGEGPRLRSAG